MYSGLYMNVRSQTLFFKWLIILKYPNQNIKYQCYQLINGINDFIQTILIVK